MNQVRFGFQLHASVGRVTGIGKAQVSREIDEVERRTLAGLFAREIETGLVAAIDGDVDYDAAIAAVIDTLGELPVDDLTLEGFPRLKLQNAEGDVLFERGARSNTEADYPQV